jgi:hypothetical protein
MLIQVNEKYYILVQTENGATCDDGKRPIFIGESLKGHKRLLKCYQGKTVAETLIGYDSNYLSKVRIEKYNSLSSYQVNYV